MHYICCSLSIKCHVESISSLSKLVAQTVEHGASKVMSLILCECLNIAFRAFILG